MADYYRSISIGRAKAEIPVDKRIALMSSIVSPASISSGLATLVSEARWQEKKIWRGSLTRKATRFKVSFRHPAPPG